MKMNAYVAGVGMTRFGKHLHEGLKAITGGAVTDAIRDAGVSPGDIQAAWVGNAAAGLVTGQECIRGQVVLRPLGIGQIPIINVENACASSSTAFNQACAMVTGGLYDIVLAVGMEKLYNRDKSKTFAAFSGAVDVEAMTEIMAGLKRARNSPAPKKHQPERERTVPCSWIFMLPPHDRIWPPMAPPSSSLPVYRRRTLSMAA